MSDADPLDHFSADIRRRARRALAQGFAMHDAATVLLAAAEFDQWARAAGNGAGLLERTAVVGFFMQYAKALVDNQITLGEQEDLFRAPGSPQNP